MAFNSDRIITEKHFLPNLRGYIVGFDFGLFRYEDLAEKLMDGLVDFAFGYHTGILEKYDRRILKEAAKSLYNIKEFKDVKFVYVDEDSELLDCEIKAQKKYLKRGEFGELILHILLRDFFNTLPLLSKLYFKDTDGGVVHGFDIVHIGADISEPSKKSIYLGESKLYSRKDNNAGKHGVKDLVSDIKFHFKKDFLKREIALIGKKKHSFAPSNSDMNEKNKNDYADFIQIKNEWFETLSKVERGESKLQDFLKSVTIPLVCTYQSELLNSYSDETNVDFINEYDKEMLSLKSHFDDELNKLANEIGEPTSTELNVILLLFPIPSKKQLVKLLHQKLYNQQNA